MEELLESHALLMDRIQSRLLQRLDNAWFPADSSGRNTDEAAVLFLLGMQHPGPDLPSEACLIFNQRSRHVRQPGDLCFPGGGVSPFLDRFLAGFLRLPGFPLHRWPQRRDRNHPAPPISHGMARLLATGLRESFEEMRLNPFRIIFLGPMAPEPFDLFNRTIYPMVATTRGQKNFTPNWEVERIVTIPLRRFLQPEAYGRVSFTDFSRFKQRSNPVPESQYPCITYQKGAREDLLWGVTYRIVMHFLKIVFDFEPPDTASRPVVSKTGGD